MSISRYLIVGGGMTGAAAARGIREVDPQASITLVSEEANRPYARPPLSKGLWTGKTAEDAIGCELPPGTEVVLGRRVVSIDRAAHTVQDDGGRSFGYQKLLLATGGSPKQLPFGDGVIYFRTLADYRALRAIPGERVTVIGGGFIGSEVAASLAQVGKKVTLVFPDAGICSRVFPADLCRNVTDCFRAKGVEVLANEGVVGIEGKTSILKSARRVEADAIVAGLGIAPNVALAKDAGLVVGDGIEVDVGLRTNDPDIFAAGDVASFESPVLGRRLRAEHEDNANTMGAAAGRSMAGAPVLYQHLPSFYSDLFDLGYEAVGTLDSRLTTCADWKTPFREGVVYYLGEGRVRGVLLWNTWNQVDPARALIAEKGPFRPEDLAGRLPR